MCRQQSATGFTLGAVVQALAAEARSTSSDPRGTPLLCRAVSIRCHTERAFKQDSVVRNEVADDVGRDARHATHSLKSFGMNRRAPSSRHLPRSGATSRLRLPYVSAQELFPDQLECAMNAIHLSREEAHTRPCSIASKKRVKWAVKQLIPPGREVACRS